MAQEKIKKYLDKISKNLLKAKTSYEIYWSLNSKESREKYKYILDDYPNFFVYLIDGSFDSFIINTNKVIENNPTSLNFHRLFKITDIDQGIKDRFDKEYEGVGKSIIVMRSNISAHSNEKFNHDEYFKINKVTYDQIRKCINNLILLIEEVYEGLSLNIPFDFQYCLQEEFYNSGSDLSEFFNGPESGEGKKIQLQDLIKELNGVCY